MKGKNLARLALAGSLALAGTYLTVANPNQVRANHTKDHLPSCETIVETYNGRMSSLVAIYDTLSSESLEALDGYRVHGDKSKLYNLNSRHVKLLEEAVGRVDEINVSRSECFSEEQLRKFSLLEAAMKRYDKILDRFPD